MRLYAPIQKLDAEQRMVWGYASTETRDDQGEIVKREALQQAIPEYMKLGNIREMHQLSAVGKAKEAAFDDDGLFLGAKVIDPLAWEKVREGVYSGFSIGGRVTKRDSSDPSIITGLTLTEISLVDRPANPDALFDVWKSSDVGPALKGHHDMGLATIGDVVAGHQSAATAAVSAPQDTGGARQRWLASDGTEHLTKAAALARSAENASAVAQAAKDVADTADIEALKAELEDAVRKGTITLAEMRVKLASAEAPAAADDGGAEVMLGDAEAAVITGDTADKAAEVDPVIDEPVASDDAAKAAVDATSENSASVAQETQQPEETEKAAAPEAPASPEQEIVDAAMAALARAEAVKASAHPEVDQQAETSETSMVSAAEPDAQQEVDQQAAAEVAEKTATAEAVGVAALPQIFKSMYDLGDVASVILFFDNLAERLKVEAAIEGDNSPAAAEARAVCDQACTFLRNLVTEETAELMAGTEVDEMDFLFMAEFVGDLRKAGLGIADQVEKAGAKHSARDQMFLDAAYTCASKCAKASGCTKALQSEMGRACEEMAAAGGKMLDDSAEKAAANTAITVLEKGGQHQAMADMAHDMLCRCTKGAVCGAMDKAGRRHSKETLDHLTKAHGHLCAAGANCDMTKNDDAAGDGNDVTMAAKAGGAQTQLIAKMTTALDEILKAHTELNEKFDAANKRIDEIAAQPMPPATYRANFSHAISKSQDGMSPSDGSPTVLDDAEAFKMLPLQDQHLARIKAAQTKPMTRLGLTNGPAPFFVRSA